MLIDCHLRKVTPNLAKLTQYYKHKLFPVGELSLVKAIIRLVFA